MRRRPTPAVLRTVRDALHAPLVAPDDLRRQIKGLEQDLSNSGTSLEREPILDELSRRRAELRQLVGTDSRPSDLQTLTERNPG